MLGPEISKKLKAVGVCIHSGGMSTGLLGITTAIMQWPIAALWEESEELTDEEIGLLGSFVRKHLGAPEDAPIKRFTIEGFNTVTFFKQGPNRWTFRRLTWDGTLWYPQPGTLEEILKKA